jgi:alginate O-acetyltransferase complex protein AlgI
MPFNSIPFIIFLLFTVTIFFAINQKYRLNLLCVASLIFYAFNNLFNAAVLLLVLFILYFFSTNRVRGKNYATASIISIIAVLILLKLFLFSFSVEHGHIENEFFAIVFPIGLSFYSLQGISYILDVNENKITVEKSISKLFIFLSFFPQALAGPIHRFNALAPQFDSLQDARLKNISVGIKTVLWGYFCKLIIADKIALVIAPILSTPEAKDGLVLLISSMLYSLQIYFDFYGYTLIAIGIGSFFGIHLNENFNDPYSSKSFRDFWKRWHISLSNWLRDFIYLRLGGRINSYWKFSLAITFTFFVSALWHGLTLNYIIWGLLHSLAYIIEDILSRSKKLTRINQHVLFRFVHRVAFFILISLLWLIFRTTDLERLRVTFRKIFNFTQWSITESLEFVDNIYFFFIILIAIIIGLNVNKWVKSILRKNPITYAEQSFEVLYIVSCILLIIIFGDLGTQEFLYFKF